MADENILSGITKLLTDIAVELKKEHGLSLDNVQFHWNNAHGFIGETPVYELEEVTLHFRPYRLCEDKS